MDWNLHLKSYEVTGTLLYIHAKDHSKSGKERQYHNQSKQTERAEDDSQIDSLFLTENGLALTMSGVQQMLRRFGKQAGISGVRCSPQTLRHTFAKNYLLNGGDIFSLQKILGHSSLASVRMYLNLFAVDIKRQHHAITAKECMLLSSNKPPSSSRSGVTQEGSCNCFTNAASSRASLKKAFYSIEDVLAISL